VKQKRFDTDKAFNPNRAAGSVAGAHSVLDELLAVSPTTVQARAAGMAVVTLDVASITPDWA
jgi:hypothetical protein